MSTLLNFTALLVGDPEHFQSLKQTIINKTICVFVDLPVDKNKSDVTSMVQKLCGSKQCDQQDIEKQISIIKKDTLNGTKCIDSIESKVINIQESLNDMDNRVVRIFEDIQNQKGKHECIKLRITYIEYVL